VPELFGLQHENTPRFYVSDGGHYDNLGLIALLQAKCKEIWCVDSAADRKGEASQLISVIQQAERELGVIINVDTSRFLADADGVQPEIHIKGTIEYPDGSTGEITVIKLGFTAETEPDFRGYKSLDKKFPHHGTFWQPFNVMWYDRDRMDHYRKLGFVNASKASARTPSPPSTSTESQD